ncbi:vicilin-like seed storage protein At2g18540 [Belonocnema kinseyi]|uniref:vicilin-like seed storage protein At2g18540 n=1 Tax=Belonocnema kinseyi TaxID=2817044 RepID=UPI00143D1920|nr:vicilin-like seed storage protein At2g18540 [Belonocnema kinseyi]
MNQQLIVRCKDCFLQLLGIELLTHTCIKWVDPLQPPAGESKEAEKARREEYDRRKRAETESNMRRKIREIRRVEVKKQAWLGKEGYDKPMPKGGEEGNKVIIKEKEEITWYGLPTKEEVKKRASELKLKWNKIKIQQDKEREERETEGMKRLLKLRQERYINDAIRKRKEEKLEKERIRRATE